MTLKLKENWIMAKEDSCYDPECDWIFQADESWDYAYVQLVKGKIFVYPHGHHEDFLVNSIEEAHAYLLSVNSESPWEEESTPPSENSALSVDSESPCNERSMAIEKTVTVIATVDAIVNDQLVAYSIILRQFPSHEHEWSLPDGTQSVSYHPSKNTIGLAKHDVNANRTLLESTDIPLEYDGNRMPTVADVEDYEWAELFTECGREWPEFNEARGSYVKRVHLISKLLHTAGVS